MYLPPKVMLPKLQGWSFRNSRNLYPMEENTHQNTSGSKHTFFLVKNPKGLGAKSANPKAMVEIQNLHKP